MTFTLEEIARVIQAAELDEGNTPGTFTSAELAEELGVSKVTVMKRIRAEVRAGRVRPVKAYRMMLDGRRLTTCYEWVGDRGQN